MADLNPILTWNQETLTRLIEESQQEVFFYTTLSRASHVGLIFFAFGALRTFGMTNPTYFPITGTLLVVGYGPACEVSVEALQTLADFATVQCQMYEKIHQNLRKEGRGNVPELKNNRILLAQWYALSPVPVPPYQPPAQLLSPLQGEQETAKLSITLNAQVENMRRKVLQAYLIHVSEHPEDLRKVSGFGEFHVWEPGSQMGPIPYAVFGKVLNTTIEEQTHSQLAAMIFN
jgi:hypothetical protein